MDYEYHKNRGNCLSPEAEAGKDMGRIFKNVMSTDFRKYEIKGSIQRKFKANLYGLAQNLPNRLSNWKWL